MGESSEIQLTHEMTALGRLVQAFQEQAYVAFGSDGRFAELQRSGTEQERRAARVELARLTHQDFQWEMDRMLPGHSLRIGLVPLRTIELIKNGFIHRVEVESADDGVGYHLDVQKRISGSVEDRENIPMGRPILNIVPEGSADDSNPRACFSLILLGRRKEEDRPISPIIYPEDFLSLRVVSAAALDANT